MPKDERMRELISLQTIGLSSIESGVESIRNNLQQRASILLQPA